MHDFPDIDAEDRALLRTAHEAARAAAAVHRDAAARPDSADWREKGRADFVTEVDREAERRALDVLRRRFPDHAFLAEEGTAAEMSPEGCEAPVRWILDPLDGTTNWLHGYPEYAVSVAAVDREGLRVGVVLDSASGELFDAVRGAGARRDGREVRTSGLAELRLALVGTGFPFKKEELLEPYLSVLGRAITATSGVRRAGSAALDLCDLACGRLDAFFEYWLMPWDVAAGMLIVREAGGVVRPLEVEGIAPGAPADPAAPDLRPGGYLAANGPLLEPFLRLLEG